MPALWITTDVALSRRSEFFTYEWDAGEMRIAAFGQSTFLVERGRYSRPDMPYSYHYGTHTAHLLEVEALLKGGG
jgi:hypothetical protein